MLKFRRPLLRNLEIIAIDEIYVGVPVTLSMMSSSPASMPHISLSLRLSDKHGFLNGTLHLRLNRKLASNQSLSIASSFRVKLAKKTV